MTTQDSIAAVIRDTLGVAVPAHDTDLIESGLIDSLSLVSLITEIERSFRVELPLDAVLHGLDERGHGEIRVHRGVDRAVLEAPRRRDP